MKKEKKDALDVGLTFVIRATIALAAFSTLITLAT